jgi:16S rRNA (cytosine967-C5)-methyltransferase
LVRNKFSDASPVGVPARGSSAATAVAPARLAAYNVLFHVASERSNSSLLLAEYEESLSGQDRRLCHELVLGVLRKQIYIDRILETLSRVAFEKLDVEVLVALRIGLYQILFLDRVPHSAAVDDSVKLVKRAKKRSASGLANAILRRAAREKTFDLKFTDDLDRASVMTSHPRWLLERWIASFGRENAVNLAAVNNEAPRLVFRCTSNTKENTLEILRKLGCSFTEVPAVCGSFEVASPDEYLRSYADQGKIYFQDPGSQLVARAVNLSNGEKFLDVCAAPGSKTTAVEFLYRLNSSGSIGIVAGDVSLKRLGILRKTADLTGSKNVWLAVYNAEKDLPFESKSFDCVLVDAPCSGTGTIRHNPEIRYVLKPSDLGEYHSRQLRILKSASGVVRDGGRLIYSTCSLEPEENEDVISDFLRGESAFTLAPPDMPPQFLNGTFARTIPYRDRMDGFFVAQMVRRGRSRA